MSSQSRSNWDLSDLEEASVFYRPVKSKDRLRDPDRENISSPSELNDVQELVHYIQNKKLNYPMPLSESSMDEMTTDRVRSIFEDDAAEHYVKDLLGLFCDTLEGRQRSEDKYAMLVYLEGQYLLAHARAERGMSLQEGIGEEGEEQEIKLIKRFLDVDNILSAALFEDKRDKVEFSHFTDSGSDSFRQFLGVNEQHLNYRRKTIQLVCYYRGLREYPCKFEFTTEEFRDKWLRDGDVMFSGDKLQFASDGAGRPHEIDEIRWGNNTYNSIQEFKSSFREETLGLSIDRDKYESLHSIPSEDGGSMSVYDADEVVDRRRRVDVIQEGGTTVIEKSDTPDNLHVIYSSEHIRMDSSFAEDIFADLAHENDVQIYHASESPAAKALELGDTTFLNISEDEVSPELREFLSSTYDHAVNRTGETVRKCLLNSMLQVLKKPAEPQLETAFHQIINIYSGNPADGATVSTKENEGENIVEYKNKQFLESGDPAKDILEEIKTEQQKGVDTKVFMWGFTEQSREIDGFPSQSWNDDRIAGIEQAVREYLSEEGMTSREFMMQPINLDGSGDRMAITGVFF
ncbi:hypothetical protein [Halorubrum sp. SD683]|uniref:hypothetical protein n=1 Tax=Halorubrum sp. SD683 TaxID=1855873 RepID=UPI00117A6E66|nr:hypothetical protein [Halorubrum sp. SD683]